MKKLIPFLVLAFSLVRHGFAQQAVPPSTGFTRQLLRSSDAAAYWANLGNAPTSTVSLTYSGQRPTVKLVATNANDPAIQGSAWLGGVRYMMNTTNLISSAGVTNTLVGAGFDSTLFNHFGDGDGYGSYLYVPIQSWNGSCTTVSNASIAVIDPATLTKVAIISVSNLMDEISCCTVDTNGTLYAFTYCNDTEAFTFAIDGTGTNLTANGMLTFPAMPSVQGAQWIDGKIYLSAGAAPLGAIFILDPSSQTTRRAYYQVFTTGLAEWEGVAYDGTNLEWDVAGYHLLDFDVSGTANAFRVDGAGNVESDSISTTVPMNLTRANGVWSGVLLSYPFDEGSGYIINDVSSNRYDAAVNTSARWVDSFSGKALDFTNGITCQSQVRSLLDGRSKFSVACWFNANHFTGSNETFVSAHSGGTLGEFLIGLTSSNALQFFTINNAASRRTVNVTNSDTLCDADWHFVVGTYDGTSNRIYLDGAEIGSAAQTGTIESNLNTIAIGSYGGSTHDYFEGSLDEVAIWGRTLTASEIQGLYRIQKPADLVGTSDVPSAAVQAYSGTVLSVWPYEQTFLRTNADVTVTGLTNVPDSTNFFVKCFTVAASGAITVSNAIPNSVGNTNSVTLTSGQTCEFTVKVSSAANGAFTNVLMSLLK